MLIRETARRVAGHRWFERRLFEVVGALAADGGDPDLQRALAAQSHHHAWRAAQWEPFLPVLHDVPAIDEPEPELVALAEAARSLDGLVGTALPGLVARYEHDLRAVTEVADAPVERVLRIVLADLRKDVVAAERLAASRQ